MKVRADAAVRSQVLEVVELFRAKVIDVEPEALTIEATGTAEKIAALLKNLEPYGIRRDGAVRHHRRRPWTALHHRHALSAERSLRERTSTRD